MRDDARQSAGEPPSIEALEALLAFVETGGVATAAEQLGLPQPTLSRRLQVFQRQDANGETLLTHRGRHLRLTGKGQAALPAIRELLRQYNQFERFHRGERTATQTVRIGSGSFGARYYLPRALADLRRRKIDCNVQTELVRGRERILGVAEGQFDLAIVTHDRSQIRTIVSASSNPKAELSVEPLATHTFCALVSAGQPLAAEFKAAPANRPLPIAILSRCEFVGLDRQSGIRLQLEAEFQKLGFPLRFVPDATAGGWDAAKEYARHGLGVAIVPLAVLAAGDEDSFAIRRLPERFAMTDHLLRRKPAADATAPEIHRALRQAAQQHTHETRERWP